MKLQPKVLVLESKIDIGRGPVVNIMVTNGTLKKGDYFVSGLKWGKIRALINDQEKILIMQSHQHLLKYLG